MSNKTLNLTDNLYQYLLDTSLRENSCQKKLREYTESIEFSQMQISPEQGQFMGLLVKMLNVKKAIEVGVFTGYSSLCIAQALAHDGELIACDISKQWTDIARQYWLEAGVDKKITLHLSPAKITLQSLIDKGLGGSIDFAFIDADKENYDQYFELCLELLRPGGCIIIDNTLWDGAVADASINDKDTLAIRKLNKKLHFDERIELSMLPVSDGLTLCLKR